MGVIISTRAAVSTSRATSSGDRLGTTGFGFNAYSFHVFGSFSSCVQNLWVCPDRDLRKISPVLFNAKKHPSSSSAAKDLPGM